MNKTPGTTLPPANPALTIVNSLTKSPNGGDPVIAKTPTRRNVADTGITLIAPVTLRMIFELYAIRTLLAVRKRSVLAMALLRRCNSAPKYASGVASPRAKTMIPTCSTLEYASSLLKSLCIRMKGTATAIDTRPKMMKSVDAKLPPTALFTRM